MRITQKPRRRLFPIRFFFSPFTFIHLVLCQSFRWVFFFFVSPSSHPSCLRCTSNGDKYLSCSVLSARATPRISCLLKHEQSRQFIFCWMREFEGRWGSVAGHQLSNHPLLTPASFHSWRLFCLQNQILISRSFFFFISDSSFSL